MNVLDPKIEGYRHLSIIVLTDDDRKKFQKYIDEGHYGINPDGSAWIKIRAYGDGQPIREVIDLNTGKIIEEFESFMVVSDLHLAFLREKITLSYDLERTRTRAEQE